MFNTKTESLVCSAIEAHENSIQLLKVLTRIFPPGKGDVKSNPVTSGPCLYGIKANRRYRRCFVTDEPIIEALRKASILSSCMHEQYSAATVVEVAALE